MWYVMQVQTGNEEMIIKLCEQVINTRKYERIFLPKCVTLKKRRGEWKELIQTLFPGYIFIDTDENRITDIIRACYAIPEVTKVLRSAENFTPIHELEQTYLREMMDDEDIVRPSVGYQVGEHVEILSGPLRYGHAKICYVDRHKRVAEIEVELFGRYTKANVKVYLSENGVMYKYFFDMGVPVQKCESINKLSFEEFIIQPTIKNRELFMKYIKSLSSIDQTVEKWTYIYESLRHSMNEK